MLRLGSCPRPNLREEAICRCCEFAARWIVCKGLFATRSIAVQSICRSQSEMMCDGELSPAAEGTCDVGGQSVRACGRRSRCPRPGYARVQSADAAEYFAPHTLLHTTHTTILYM